LGLIKLKTNGSSERTELILSPRSGPFLTIILAAFLCGTISLDIAGAGEIAQKNFPPGKKNLEDVVSFLNKGFPAGNLLNDYEWGDYLLYAFDKPPKVFIDGRADMYGEDIFSDHSKILGMDKEAEELLEKYDIGWTLLLKNSISNRYLTHCKGWNSVYSDDEIEILVKNDHR